LVLFGVVVFPGDAFGVVLFGLVLGVVPGVVPGLAGVDGVGVGAGGFGVVPG